MVGLHPHIPHQEGLKTMKRYHKREDQSVSSDGLYKVVKTILKHNYFEFGQDVCHQILGAAIGTKFGTQGANNFMSRLEEEIFGNTEF